MSINHNSRTMNTGQAIIFDDINGKIENRRNSSLNYGSNQNASTTQGGGKTSSLGMDKSGDYLNSDINSSPFGGNPFMEKSFDKNRSLAIREAREEFE